MKRILLWCVLFGICAFGKTQHPFYLNMLEEGKRFMAAENWEMADRYLEIAAFGLLEEPDLLREIYLCLVVVQDRFPEGEKGFKYLSRAKRLLGPSPERPPEIPWSLWRQYRDIASDPPIEAPPAPTPEQKPENASIPVEELKKEPPVEVLEEDLAEEVYSFQLHDNIDDLDTQSAEAYRGQLERAIKDFPDDSDLKFRLVDLYIHGRSLGKAKKLIRELAKSQAGNDRYTGTFAHYNFVKGDHKKNIQFFGEKENLPPKAAYYAGLSYFEAKDFNRAQGLWRGLSREEYPRLAEIESQLDKQQEEGAQIEARTAEVARIRELDPKFRNGQASRIEMLELAHLHMEAGNWASAKRVGRKAYEDFPSQDSFYIMGRIYLQDGNYKQASLIFYNLANSGYKKGEVFFYGGKAALHNGDASLAGYMFNRAEAEGTRFLEEIRDLRNQSLE